MKFRIAELLDCARANSVAMGDRYVHARPDNWKSERLLSRVKNAWLVIARKADIVTWDLSS